MRTGKLFPPSRAGGAHTAPSDPSFGGGAWRARVWRKSGTAAGTGGGCLEGLIALYPLLSPIGANKSCLQLHPLSRFNFCADRFRRRWGTYFCACLYLFSLGVRVAGVGMLGAGIALQRLGQVRRSGAEAAPVIS